MSSTRSSTVSGSGKQHKKILRTQVKLLARRRLGQHETFNVDMAEQLIRRAVSNKAARVTTTLKALSDGLQLGDKAVLAPVQAQFIGYPSITAFISLREMPNILAVCSRDGPTHRVIIVQFKDVAALHVFCEVIDKQRGLMTNSMGQGTSDIQVPASSISRVEVSPPQPPPTVVVTESPPADEPEAVTVTVVTNSSDAAVEGGGSGGELFERRPFAAEITQPPAATTTIVVHETTTSRAVQEDDDENFRTSIVFGSEAVSDSETVERQRRMEALLERRQRPAPTSGVVSASSKAPPPSARTPAAAGTGCIDTEILNYDDIDDAPEGTHAVFDSADGPPIQLNESATANLRRPDSLRVEKSPPRPVSGSSASGRAGGSRMVVTSFSSGRSDSQAVPPESSSSGAFGGSSYRTSTVIYRDGASQPQSVLDSPTDRQRARVTYVTGNSSLASPTSPPMQLVHQPPSPQQPMQLVRLVPVGSARRRLVQQAPQPPPPPQTQPQYYTIQPVASARENGVRLVAK